MLRSSQPRCRKRTKREIPQPSQHRKKTTSSPHSKLNKQQIDHIKSLHTPNGRLQSKTFLLEGRKQIESVCQSTPTLLDFTPHQVFMTYDQYNEISELLQESTTSNSPASLQPNISSNSIPISPASSSTLSTMLDKYKNETFLNHSTQHQWQHREDGRLVPPSTHSLNSSTSTPLSPQQITLYKHLIRNARIIDSQLLTRLSQFATPPGIICECPFLPNIIIFPTASQEHGYGVQHGTIFQPLTSSQSPTSQSRQSTRSSQESQQPSTSNHLHNASHSQTWSWLNGGLILYGLNDPGNVGTLIRTAHSFGIDQIALVDCADVYNHKVIAASVGSLASPTILSCSSSHFLQLMNELREVDDMVMQKTSINQPQQLLQPFLIGLTPTRGIALESLPHSLQQHIVDNILTSSDKTTNFPSLATQKPNKPWLVVGSEAYGLPAQIETTLHTTATIKMCNDNVVGSLNAAVAGSIATFHFASILKH